MAFKDELLRCAACGKTFYYTVREQRLRADQGLPKESPTFCPECRGGDVRLRGIPVPDDDETAEGPDTTTERQADTRGAPPAVSRPPEARPVRRDDRPDRRAPSRPDGGYGAAPRQGGYGADRRPRGGSAGRPANRSGGRPSGARFAGPGGRGRPPAGGRSGGARARRGPERARQQELRIRYTGVVKWFDDARGFGFIAQEEGDEVFVHTSGIIVDNVTTLHEGQPVEYEVERTMRGLQAVDVIPLAW